MALTLVAEEANCKHSAKKPSLEGWALRCNLLQMNTRSLKEAADDGSMLNKHKLCMSLNRENTKQKKIQLCVQLATSFTTRFIAHTLSKHWITYRT